MNPDINLISAVVLLFIAANFKAVVLTTSQAWIYGVTTASITALVGGFLWVHKSPQGRLRKKYRTRVLEIPESIKDPSCGAVLGKERDLGLLITLPRSVRLKHTHILGATGAGKTESVILNLLGQDIASGTGAIILDGKGDDSFLKFLRAKVEPEKLRVFDLSELGADRYDPLADGSPAEAAQRLFSSLTWSEEYYKSKASAALQRIFHAQRGEGNRPTLADINEILSCPQNFISAVSSEGNYSAKDALADYLELSGLRDQVALLCAGHLKVQFGSGDNAAINLGDAYEGSVIYFRLQSLLSRQLAGIVGRLVINHLSYLAGSAHRAAAGKVKFVPVFLDEFATFACPEFADLISKARSAGFALHFSHQSVGDLEGVKDGFLSQIMDNSATKIVMRINDPDTADVFSRAFGTQKSERVTKRVSNATDPDLAISDGFGSLREVREFRASPDLLKTLPTGVGAVLIAHGEETPHGGSSVFQIRFPRLT